MKVFFTALFFISVMVSPARAQEDAWSYTEDDLHPGESIPINEQEEEVALKPSEGVENNDPLESFNRGIFWFNDVIDSFFLERLSEMYKDVVPEFMRERVGYVLRNLNEPLVLANNILQGRAGDAENTVRRFLINSTVGLAGIFDVSTDLEIPYKKEDFGLTLASWGFESGPYIVLPILGPSNLRDTVGRIGDYAFDPINWWGYFSENEIYTGARTGVQILDAKTDTLEILKDLRKNSLDYYATLRTWYDERRKALIRKERGASETPRPDDDDEQVNETPRPDEEEKL